MEEEYTPETPQTEETGYKPRPVWQVWAARIALAVFLVLILLYYINLARGGL